MSITELKAAILQRIENVNDEAMLKQLLNSIEALPSGQTGKVRLRGSGKHIFGEMSDDFNDPLEDFADYM